MAATGREKGAPPLGLDRREIVALVCGQCVPDDFHPSRVTTRLGEDRLKVFGIPCTSKIETSNLLSILETGADGILVVGCLGPRCQFRVGSSRAAKRIAHAQGLLDEIGIGSWRLRLRLGGMRDPREIVELAEDLAREARSSPPNPIRALRTRVRDHHDDVPQRGE
jgi:coenzyme F420-reducing hydrogenase delta subunit